MPPCSHLTQSNPQYCYAASLRVSQRLSGPFIRAHHRCFISSPYMISCLPHPSRSLLLSPDVPRDGQNEILNFHLPISLMHCLHLDQWGWEFGAQLCPLGWPPEISEGTCWCGEEGDEVVCHLGNEQHWKSFGHLAESLRKAESCSLQG